MGWKRRWTSSIFQSFADRVAQMNISQLIKAFTSLLILFALSGCHPKNRQFEPEIFYLPNQRCLHRLPSAFPSQENTRDEWNKEMYIGHALAKDFDLYRAITCYKRALILMPPSCQALRLQAEYCLSYCYYLGRRYPDFLETVEFSPLFNVPESFPPFRDLTVMLFDAYEQTGQLERACRIQNLINTYDPAAGANLNLYLSLKSGDLAAAMPQILSHPQSDTMLPYLNCYQTGKKSVAKAQLLNALLPGAGYYYVGQKKSAITSFILNALFIAATVQFAEKGYIPAAIITGSFELGWYVGGINGAGLAAKEYNERLYECQMKEMMIQHGLFPLLMLKTAF
jgi:tetratricopeptide (TPR) repeat protein